MHTEIYSRRYDLQYMLYSIALHRFLQNRLPDYNYEMHFGGVYYLYLRGMRIESKTGVFFTVPEGSFIEQLNHLF
jgi:exodeoxyribonuclease V beta subunit